MKRLNKPFVLVIIFSIFCEMFIAPLENSRVLAAENTKYEIQISGYTYTQDMLIINQINKSYKLYIKDVQNVSWLSSDTDIATVSSTGLVTSVSNGVCKIYAIANSQRIASIDVKVLHYGDIDSNGEISATDAAELCKVLNDKENLTGIKKEIFDLDGSGEVDNNDLTYLTNCLLGDLSKFPIEERLRGIFIVKMPNKVRYITGEKLDTTGMVVEGRYNDGSCKIINNWELCSSNTVSKNSNAVKIKYTQNGSYNNGSTVQYSKTAFAEFSVTVSDRVSTNYTITYNANGGTGTPSSQTKAEGDSITLSSIKPTRTGYEFLGWSTSRTATYADSNYTPGSKYDGNDDLTLYAVWKEKEYTIKFDSNGGYNPPSIQKKIYGKTITLSSDKPTKTGYEFLGWSTDKYSENVDYNSGDTYKKEEDVTLYAVWKKEEYTVTYNVNGGSGSIQSQKKLYDTNLTLSLVKPTKTGSEFLGWSTSSLSNTVEYYPGAVYTVNAPLTLYAVWKANQYTIKYDAGGGWGAPENQTKNYGISIRLSDEIPYRTGYDFEGWTILKNSNIVYYSPSDIYGNDSDITLYAVWKIKEYTIIYDATGGWGEPDDQIKEYGEELLVSDDIPSKTGCEFLGWSLSRSGSVDYMPGDVYSYNSDATLYAVWKNKYKPILKNTQISVNSNIKKEYGVKKFKLKVNINSNGKRRYKTSNKKIVTIDKNGYVKIKGYGKVTITISVGKTSEYKAATKMVKLYIVPDMIKKFYAKSYSNGRVKFTWKKVKVKNAKCQIQASTSKDFPDEFTKVVKPCPKLQRGKFIADGLKSGKIYYFRARVVVKVSGKNYCSVWSEKKIKIR